MTSVKKRTARTLDEVRVWLETTPHHIAAHDPEQGQVTHMLLRGYHEQLRVPVALWRAAFVRVVDNDLDNRIYAWDYRRERYSVFPKPLPNASETLRRVRCVFEQTHVALHETKLPQSQTWDTPFPELAPRYHHGYLDRLVETLETEFRRLFPLLQELPTSGMALTYNNLLRLISPEAYALHNPIKSEAETTHG